MYNAEVCRSPKGGFRRGVWPLVTSVQLRCAQLCLSSGRGDMAATQNQVLGTPDIELMRFSKV